MKPWLVVRQTTFGDEHVRVFKHYSLARLYAKFFNFIETGDWYEVQISHAECSHREGERCAVTSMLLRRYFS